MLLFVITSLPEILRWDSLHVGRLFTPRCMTSIPATGTAGIPWAADNDAFSGFDEDAFYAMLGQLAGTPGGKFVTAPDVVGDARMTRRLFERWHPTIRDYGLPVGYVLQDGLSQIGVPWDECSAVFVGGTTEFKLSPEAEAAVREAKERGKWVHMGRVNTVRRIRRAQHWGCDSVDGSKWGRWTRTWMPQALAVLEYEQKELA